MSSLLESLSLSIDGLMRDATSVASYLEKVRDELASHYGSGREARILNWSHDRLLVVVGDLHGDMSSLKKILSGLSMDSLSKGETRVVFLGDYVDRGPDQLGVLLYVLELWRRYPGSVAVLRGNHEPPRHLIPYPHDFPETLIMQYGYERGVEIYDHASRVFELLPVSLIVNNEILCLHGGLPTSNYRRASSIEEYLAGTGDHEYTRILTEILWNDPVEDNVVRIPSPRGAGYLWGRPVTRWVYEAFGVKAVVRGHEPVPTGYKVNHEGRVLTLFSRRGPPYNNEVASYLRLELGEGWFSRLLDSIVFI